MNGALESVLFGGIPATLASGADVSTLTVTNNSLSFGVTVPATAALGALKLEVVGVESGSINNYVVSGVPVNLNPDTAVANQKITISGTGFSTAGGTVIESSSADADDLTIDGTTIIRDQIAVDSSGNVVFTVTLPNHASATRTAGVHQIRVEDSTGRVGEANLTVPAREITIDPAESRRASTVTVTGSGFVANTNVGIDYGTTAIGSGIVSVVADSAGNFITSFKVPTVASAAPIPSNNTITATSAGTGAERTATALHKIPAASIVADPPSAKPGESATIMGAGFPGFSTVSSITVGGVASTPIPGPATIGDGTFTATVLVPQLDLGTQAIVATAGGVSANSSITITEQPVVAPVVRVVSGPPADAFESLISADNLVRAWYFDPSVQSVGPFFGWFLYDPRPVFADVNSITSVETGQFFWLLVKEQTTVTLGGVSRTLYPPASPVTW
jgi:hypothetical protein